MEVESALPPSTRSASRQDDTMRPYTARRDYSEPPPSSSRSNYDRGSSMDQGPGPATIEVTPPRQIERRNGERSRPKPQFQPQNNGQNKERDGSWLNVEQTVSLFQRKIADARRDTEHALAGDEGVSEAIKPTLTIDLGRSRIRRLPEAVLDLIMADVERLSLSHNALSVLPPRISECRQLRYLNIRTNNFSAIPEGLYNMPLLEILDVSRNKISVISPEIKNLENLRVFSIQHNKLRTLPVELCSLTRLKVIKVAENSFGPEIRRVIKAKESEVTYSQMIENERDAVMTAELLKYLRKQGSTAVPFTNGGSIDASDGSLEIPKPPLKRVLSGRFPITLTASLAENQPDTSDGSPNQGKPPSIPIKSHLRVASGQSNGLMLKRPGPAPVTAGSERNRSNSESVIQASAAARQKRMGMMKKERSELDSIDETKVMRHSHLRGVSYASGLRRTGSISSPGGANSSPISPKDTRKDRGQLVRRLSSLPEQRIHPISRPMVEGAKGVLYALYQVYPHISGLISAIRDKSDRYRSGLEMSFYNAAIHIDKLNQDIELAANIDSEDMEALDRNEETIVEDCATCVKGFVHVTTQMQENVQKLVANADLRYVRTLMLLIYGSIIEIRNAVKSLGIDLKGHRRQMSSGPTHTIPTIPEEGTPPDMSKHSRTPSRELNSLTLRPTNRIRSETILPQQMPPRHLLQPVQPPQIQIPDNMHYPGAPLQQSYSRGSSAGASGGGSFSERSRSASRSTAMTANSDASFHTPRSVDSYNATHSNAVDSSARAHNGSADAQAEAVFEQIFLALTKAYETALQGVPIAMKQFQRCLEAAEDQRQSKELQDMWLSLTRRCKSCLELSEALQLRLSNMRIKDSGVGLHTISGGRDDPSFWMLCKTFLQSFIDLVTDMREAKSLRILPQEVMSVLRPVQRTSRDAGRLIESSPWRSLTEGLGQMPAPTPFTPQNHNPTHMYQHNGYATTANGNLSAYSGTTTRQTIEQSQDSRQTHMYNPHQPPTPLTSISMPGLATPSSINSIASPLGTQMPATPMTAALGPAAQATIPSTPASAYGDSFFKGDVFQRAEQLMNMPQAANSVNFLNRR